VAALKLRRDQQDADRRRAAGAWVDTGLVFTTRHGTAMEPRNFSRSFDRCLRKARVTRITVHGTRKTCGSLLAALDVHPRVAMQILGHNLSAPMVWCWDNLNIHLAPELTKFATESKEWLRVYRLPAYTPDLNPVEGNWAPA
jgi:integrase